MRRRRLCLVEVADQTNADAEVIEAVVRTLGMRPPLLLGPARADLDLTVAAVGAVADEEVVAHLVKAAVDVPLRHDRGIAEGSRRVMDDDPLPVIDLD